MILKNYITIIVAAIVILWPFTIDAAGEDEEDVYFILMGEADQAINDKNYAEAAARLKDAINVRPDAASNVLLMSNLGMVYSAMGQDSLALATLDKAHQIAPSMVTVILNRARIRLKMGDDARAYDDFAKVIALDSLDATARYYHGMIALYGGDLGTAGRDFEVLRDSDPDGFDTKVAMANYYELMRNDAEAIKYYKSLIGIDPAVEFYSGLAGCYLAIGDLSAASETIADGMKLYPRDPELYYYRAWLNRDRFRLDDAHSDARIAIGLGADSRKVGMLFKK